MKDFFSFLHLWSWLLTMTSGLANAYTLLLFQAATAHHTGNISKIAVHLAEGKFSDIFPLFLLILFFLMGSVLCGILFHEQVLEPKRRYGVLLISLGGLLMVAFLFLPYAWSIYMISFLSGAQNAMFLYIQGYLTRTSHLTGYLTDTGFSLGRIIAGYSEDWKKLRFNLSHILAFFVGALIAGIGYYHFQTDGVILISALYILAGLLYFLKRRTLFHKAGSK